MSINRTEFSCLTLVMLKMFMYGKTCLKGPPKNSQNGARSNCWFPVLKSHFWCWDSYFLKEALCFCMEGLPLFGKEGSGTPIFKVLVSSGQNKDLIDTGFPRALENLENHKKKFHAWKNHGIWKKLKNHGKIMELCEIICVFDCLVSGYWWFKFLLLFQNACLVHNRACTCCAWYFIVRYM